MSASLLTVFGAGLLTLVTPCILPMIPVYLALLLGAGIDSARSSSGRFRLVGAASLFVVGFAMVFTAMGMAASSLGMLLRSHRPLLLLLGGALVVGMGLKYLGVLRLNALDSTLQLRRMETGSRALNALLFGVVFALGWTPCVGPVLGTVLTYTAATTSSPWVGGAYLATYSLGIGLPLLLVSALAERMVPAIRRLQRHLPRFEKATGLAMVLLGLGLAAEPAAAMVRSVATPTDDVAEAAGSPPIGTPSSRPRMVHLYSPDCPVCDRMAPDVEQLRRDCVGKRVEIVSVDVSDPRNAGIAATLGVSGVPHVELLDAQGASTGRLLGERRLSELRAAAASLIDLPCAGQAPNDSFEPHRPACSAQVAGSEAPLAAEAAECTADI